MKVREPCEKPDGYYIPNVLYVLFCMEQSLPYTRHFLYKFNMNTLINPLPYGFAVYNLTFSARILRLVVNILKCRPEWFVLCMYEWIVAILPHGTIF